MSRARQQMFRDRRRPIQERIEMLVQNVIDNREAGRAQGWSPMVLEDIQRRAFEGLGFAYTQDNIDYINSLIPETEDDSVTVEDASSVEIEPEERGEGGGR